jgi:hypothetical protein
MQTPVHTIVKNLFQRDSLEEVSEEQLQQYISHFPYSSVGHILLAKKKKESGEDYRNESATAALYINNPLWLHCFLESSPNDFTVTDRPIHTEPAQETAPTPVEQPVVAEAVPEEQFPPVNETLPEAKMEEPVQAPEPVASEEAPVPPQESVSEKTVVENEVVFEPYHTIDYFASQGIKLKAEDLAKDKFGRQLKSFTDWLRTMKRIAPVPAEGTPADATPDPAIAKKAEESVETSDVETEAMAEVWIKQGKPARAVAIYRKLSLLNPSKSHYFAAKIEQLNA